MINEPTPKTKEQIAFMIDSLGVPIKSLTPWEEQFLESVSDQFDRSSSLSDKQFEILERIYSEKT